MTPVLWSALVVNGCFKITPGLFWLVAQLVSNQPTPRL